MTLPSAVHKHNTRAIEQNLFNEHTPRWATDRQLADYLGISVRSVERWTAAGLLTRYKAGPKLVRYDLNEADALLRPIA